MIFISHRGNINQPRPELENSLDYIKNALDCGFNVEIDVWFKNGVYYLGHDEPQYLVTRYFLEDKRLWCHAKNIDALYAMLQYDRIHCFWHDNDLFTLTSKNYIWTYPGNILTSRSVAVLPEKAPNIDWRECFGICSDLVEQYQEQYNDSGPQP